MKLLKMKKNRQIHKDILQLRRDKKTKKKEENGIQFSRQNEPYSIKQPEDTEKFKMYVIKCKNSIAKYSISSCHNVFDIYLAAKVI